ncbi:MAG: CmcI family methyltransferase [Gaiellaceae bacterium]
MPRRSRNLRELVPERLRLRWRRRRRTPRAYRRRYRMRGREWMLRLYDELTERESRWMGVRSLKNPLDAWVYQEILFEVRPEVVVELGSAFGGSTLFLCHMLDLVGLDAQVVSVDVAHSELAAEHPRIAKVSGNTRDPAVVARVRELCEGKRVLVIHDADHAADVVIEDLRDYGPLVAPGSYLIVEDGVRDFLGGLDGPFAAVEQFLSESRDFEVDESRERYLFTYNPRGFLRRVSRPRD